MYRERRWEKINRIFKDDKTTEEAYLIIKAMEERGLTVAEAKQTAEKVVEMLKENRMQSQIEGKHKVLFEISDIILR